MSVWRRKAIECLPDFKIEFEKPGTSVRDVFVEMLPAVIKAHRENDRVKLAQIYGFAEWCFQQKEKELWNAAGVCFYEHLGDYEETVEGFWQWVKPDIYSEIRGLLELRLQETKVQALDRLYNFKQRPK